MGISLAWNFCWTTGMQFLLWLYHEKNCVLYVIFSFQSPDLKVTILVSGCSFYEEGCGCTDPKLPKSTFKATMPPSQCHAACMADISWLFPSKHIDFITNLVLVHFFVLEFLGGSRNRWSLCSDDTPALSFCKDLTPFFYKLDLTPKWLASLFRPKAVDVVKSHGSLCYVN